MARSTLFWLLTVSLMAQTNGYKVERLQADGVEIVVLRDESRKQEVRVAPSLGNNSYEFTMNGKRVLWSPFSSLKEFLAKPSHAGNPFLWPWANRIDGMTYVVNGKRYALNTELGNVRPSPRQTPIHGLLVYEKRWQVERVEATNEGAVVVSRLDFSRYPELLAQFPFAHVVRMTYRLKGGALEVVTEIENQSAEPLPLSLGFHPYFQVNDAPRDQWRVVLPARKRYALSDRLIPTGETQNVPSGGAAPLEGRVLDDVFGDLIRDADGFSRFSVQGKREKVTVEYGPEYKVAVVYAPAGRDFICFEPMTAITNAFNAAHSGWYKGLDAVPPAGSWRAVFRIVAENF